MSHNKKMFIWCVVIFIVIFVAGIVVWRAVFSVANPELPRATVTIGSSTFNAELATTMVQQARGLSGRTGLGANDGMLFLFGSSTVQTFWMKDMNFPIDMIWIGSDKVLGFEQNAPAPAPGTQLWELPIYASPDGVDTVLEVVAGTVLKDNITIGEPVTIVKS